MEATLKPRHCWGFEDKHLPQLTGDPIKVFKHGLGLGTVSLYRDERGRYWSTAPRKSYRPEDEGVLVLEHCPVAEHRVGSWGRSKSVRCHTTNPTHPWNEGREKPGYETCGHCGWPTWIEAHGYAAGGCERCGYEG